jgi:hypothetical protein
VKLLLENWREYLNEAEDPKHLDELESFLKNIAILVQAAEDAGGELEEGAGRKARMARQSRREHTRKIKEMVGLAGIKFADFTPEQKNLYKTAKEELRQEEQDTITYSILKLETGNILEVPIIRQLVALGGMPLKLALTAAVAECSNNLTLTCLTKYYTANAQTGG